LWRTSQHLPERGRFGIFNRSYYEEVLVVRVHPELLAGQRLPDMPSTEALFEGRYESIRDHEKHLARNGTVILKFFLHVSKEEQRERLIARIDDPAKNWKFDAADLHGRANWDAYQAAYERALRETSRPWAPWFVIPADNKPAMQYLVADIVARTLESMKLRYPKLDPDGLAALAEARKQLDSEAG
jgi:polyphosphate kinase 2 (PPK2 family)